MRTVSRSVRLPKSMSRHTRIQTGIHGIWSPIPRATGRARSRLRARCCPRRTHARQTSLNCRQAHLLNPRMWPLSSPRPLRPQRGRCQMQPTPRSAAAKWQTPLQVFPPKSSPTSRQSRLKLQLQDRSQTDRRLRIPLGLPPSRRAREVVKLQLESRIPIVSAVPRPTRPPK